MRLACRDEGGLTGSREMKSKLITLILGIVTGLALGLGGSYFFGQRYTITQAGNKYTMVKVDRWTGRSWMAQTLRPSQARWEEIKQ